MNILLIDDDRDCLEGLASAIEPAGYGCEIYTIPEKAVAAYDDAMHQVVITDMKMPGLTGIQVLKLIKAKNTKAKVIIMTGYGDVDTAIAAVNNGAHSFFSKPVNIAEIIDVLEKIEHEAEAQKLELAEALQMREEYRKLKAAYAELQTLLKRR